MKAIPTFFVADVRRAAEWYVRVLGFRVEFLRDDYAGVEREEATLHLALRERFSESACYLRVADVEAFVAAVLAAGQPLFVPLKDHPDYGMREATVRDPDGNFLFIGQPLD